ncbi:MAG: aminoglycoside 6'-N-acetyltransferase [Reinekea sp.]|jgi:aminoglycoside 6'-N-acetyltransferase I|nr:aminoglycoside 6'-N-acetyltransferase [Reinekea sp.]
MIKSISAQDLNSWLELRQQLWGHCSTEQHLSEMRQLLDQPERFQQWMSTNDRGIADGFLEGSVRTEYVNGTQSSPVGYLEGIFVTKVARRCGIAKLLVDEALGWFSLMGCEEVASDTEIDNEVSQVVHKSLGFEETERVVYFRKRLAKNN